MTLPQIGGMITRNELLDRIVSIGFELESPDISPINLEYAQGDNGGTEIYLRMTHTDENMGNGFVRSTDTTMVDQNVTFDTLMQAGMHSDLIGLLQPNSDDERDDIVPIFVDPRPFERARERDEQVFYHTEFKVTYEEIDQSDNVILIYLLQTLQRVRTYLIGEDTTINRVDFYPDGGDIAIYQDPDWGIDQPYDTYLIRNGVRDDFMYIVPSDSRSPELYPLSIIPWEIQCTIGVHITDLIDVLAYLVQGVESDVSECWERVYIASLEEMHAQPEHLSELERGLIFLFSMYMCKDMLGLHKGIVGDNSLDFRVGVRHNFAEVYRYHRERDALSQPVIAFLEGNNPNFGEVTRIPYNGIVLLELRDFFLQFLMVTGLPITPESLAKGIPLDTIEEALVTYLQAEADAELADVAEGIAQLAVGEADAVPASESLEPVIARLGDMSIL